MDMRYSETPRGFARYDFGDFNGQKCSLQKSSIVATTASDKEIEAIWLGVDMAPPGQKPTFPARMHLTRDQVASLLPVLQHFVMTGEVSDSPSFVSIPSR